MSSETTLSESAVLPADASPAAGRSAHDAAASSLNGSRADSGPLPVRSDDSVASTAARRSRWGAIVLAWTVPALVASYADYGAAALRGHPMPFWRALAIECPGWYVWIPLTPLILAFARRFPVRGLRPVRPLLAHLALMSCAAIAYAIVYAWSNAVFRVPQLAFTRQYLGIVLIGSALMTLVLYATTLAVGLALAYDRRDRAREVRTSALAAQLARAELQTLRGQLHPHMLFNALHTIALLARRNDGKEAARVTTLLAGVLRSVLESDAADERTLGEEIALVEQYLDIELVRFADRLTVEWHVAPEARNAVVPTLLMQPLVENALRHGIARSPDGGVVAIAAARDGNALDVSVWNQGPSLPLSPTGRRGVGLRNTADRLERLYGAAGSLAVTNDPRGGVIARVRVPWREVAPVFTPYELGRNDNVQTTTS